MGAFQVLWIYRLRLGNRLYASRKDLRRPSQSGGASMLSLRRLVPAGARCTRVVSVINTVGLSGLLRRRTEYGTAQVLGWQYSVLVTISVLLSMNIKIYIYLLVDSSVLLLPK